MASIPKSVWHRFQKPERRRTYYFPDGKAEFLNVVGLAVSDNGTHYLFTDSGGKFIVRCGWLYIDLDMDDFTYPGPFLLDKVPAGTVTGRFSASTGGDAAGTMAERSASRSV